MSGEEILAKAIEFEESGRHIEALNLNLSEIDDMLPQCKAETDPERKRIYRIALNRHMERVENMKKSLPAVGGAVVDKIHIEEGVTGYRYERLFGKYLDNDVTEVRLDEPYLLEHYQLTNLLRFCELLVLRCRNLKCVIVTTTKDTRSNSYQGNGFTGIQKSMLDAKRIQLEIRFSENLHDRQVILNNGYVIKIGRGLNYFKRTATKYSLGYYNNELRQCLQCNVEVLFCRENMRTK